MGKMCFRFRGRKKNNNISLQAIRRWENRTFLGKWWQQQDAVLFILTNRQIISSICNQEEWTHARTVDLSQQTLGLQFPLQSFLSGCRCLCFVSTRQAVSKSNHPPSSAPRTTSIVSIDSPVIKVWQMSGGGGGGIQTHPSVGFRAMWCGRQRK